MSKEETGNKEASGCCASFGFGFKGFKDALKAFCGTEGERPDCRTMFEKFRNTCCASSEENEPAGKDE